MTLLRVFFTNTNSINHDVKNTRLIAAALKTSSFVHWFPIILHIHHDSSTVMEMANTNNVINIKKRKTNDIIRVARAGNASNSAVKPTSKTADTASNPVNLMAFCQSYQKNIPQIVTKRILGNALKIKGSIRKTITANTIPIVICIIKCIDKLLLQNVEQITLEKQCKFKAPYSLLTGLILIAHAFQPAHAGLLHFYPRNGWVYMLL